MSEVDPELRAALRDELAQSLGEYFDLDEAFEAGSLSAANLVRKAFRLFHNVKGAVRIAGFAELEILAHQIEDELSRLRDSNGVPSPALLGGMRDALTVAVQRVEGAPPADALALVEELAARLAAPAPDAALVPALPAATPAELPGAPEPAAPASSASALRDTVRVDAERFDRMMSLASEHLAERSRRKQHVAALLEHEGRVAQLARKHPELRAVFAPLARELSTLARTEERDLRRSGQLAADLDDAMRDVRMQPLELLGAYFRRVASEAARELGKNAHVTLSLGGVEIDRAVLDRLREPLRHLLRNAVDHGIEPGPERIAAGKPARGEVRIEARIRGSLVEIDVADDGRGVDAARVLSLSAARGIGAEGDEDERVLVDRALFSPGFSTASEVGHISGRGVGLDAVSAAVHELGGRVARLETAGPGSHFRVIVPSSVLSLRGLLVEAGGGTFVLPSAHVERTFRVGAAQVRTAEGSAAVAMGSNEPLRLRWLSAAMSLPRLDDGATLSVVVVADGNERCGLVVDQVRDEASFVVKQFPWNVVRVRGVTGATHYGGEELALVVDVPHVVRGHVAARTEELRVQTPARRAAPKILVADDSLTSRTLQRNILSSAGYDVETVVDGDAAWEALGKGDFALLVSDVQMPGLDGFALTRRVRADARLKGLPVILVTSLDRPEDVAEGAAAGANDYIVKGRFDQSALLEVVERSI